MNDKSKYSKKQAVDRARSKHAAVASHNDVQAFLGKVAALPKSTGTESRLVFALDATASRQLAWDRASQLQKEMFISTQSMGGLRLQLCYFQGLATFYHSAWQTDADQLLALMSRIRCAAGLTQIQRLLKHVIAENSRQKIKAVIYIGDAMEENIDRLCHLAGQLGLLRVPLFIFQEGLDPVARGAYQQMAYLSGGAWCQFDASSIDQLRDLLKAVAIYVAGGLGALEDFSKTSHKSVKLLGSQLK